MPAEHVIRRGTLAVRMADGNHLPAVGLLERIADLANAVDRLDASNRMDSRSIVQTLDEARQVAAEARYLGVIERRAS